MGERWAGSSLGVKSGMTEKLVFGVERTLSKNRDARITRMKREDRHYGRE